VPRDTTVRQRVIDYLVERGPVEDKSGRATSRLKEAVGYQGGDAGFIRIVSLMAESGDILRDVRGKRTYRISLSEELAARPPRSAFRPMTTATTSPDPFSSTATSSARLPAPSPVEDGQVDYDQLAAAVLARLARTVSEAEGDGRNAGDDRAAWARRRIDQLEGKVATLQRDLARARAEVQAITGERDELQGRYDAATHNLEMLTEQQGARPAPPAERAAEGLDREEQALLYRLRGPSDPRPPGGPRRSASPDPVG
jgi:hypothetical protein